MLSKGILYACASVVVLAFLPATANAGPVTFSGIDGNGSELALSSTPNSDAARNSFFSNLSGVGTETFESLSGSAPLNINFGAAGTATINGSGTISTVVPGNTNGAGRYSAPSLTSSRFLEVDAGANFNLTFSDPIAAFGFYGIDIGDFNGTVTLQLTDTLNNVTNLAVPAAASNFANASVLYFGFYDLSTQYKQITFSTTSGSGDIFAFDDFSIGSTQQVVVSVPEPGSISLIGSGLSILAAAGWRRKRKTSK